MLVIFLNYPSVLQSFQAMLGLQQSLRVTAETEQGNNFSTMEKKVYSRYYYILANMYAVKN